MISKLMFPITAAPPSLPQNAPITHSVSFPEYPLSPPASPPPKRRSASLPPMTLFRPLSPTPRPTFRLAVDPSDPEQDTRHHNNTVPVQDPLLHIAQREASRRYHALSELLSTELGYLLDLRTLVSVDSHPSALAPGIKPFLPGVSSSPSRFEKPFVLATSPGSRLVVKSHRRLLFASSYSSNPLPGRVPPHTIPLSPQRRPMFSDFDPPCRGPRFTAFCSRESGKMYHAASLFRL